MLDKATPVFKDLGLTQDQAQKLVSLYGELIPGSIEASKLAVETMRAGWREQVNKDSEMGGKLETIKADIGRSLALLPPQVSNEFKAAMDLTGAGDHPAFVKAFWKLSQLLNEGQHVAGGTPSPHGQKAPGTDTRPSLANAIYPNLPH